MTPRIGWSIRAPIDLGDERFATRLSGSTPRVERARSTAIPARDVDAMAPSLGATGPGATVAPGRAAEVVPPPAAAPTSVNPLEILRYVRSGTITMRMPMNPGDYGEGIDAFTIVDSTPPPYVELICRVEGGRIVPAVGEENQLTFHPPLENFAWITTPGFHLGEDGRIIADLAGWFEDKDMTRSLLGIDAVPLNLTELYTLIEARANAMGEAASSFVGGGDPFDTSGYSLRVDDAILSRGRLPVPDPAIELRIGEGTRVSVVADGRGVAIDGAFCFDRVDISRPELALAGGRTTAHGTVRIAMNPDTHAVDGVRVELEDVAVTARRARITDTSGSAVELLGPIVRGGRVSVDMDMDEDTADPPLSIEIPRVVAALRDTTLVVGERTIAIDDGGVSGSFALRDGRLALDLETATLSASGEGLTTGGGQLTLGYSEATVRGNGSVVYADGVATFAGDLQLSGTIDDARIGVADGPVSLDVAPGALVELHVAEACFGEDGVRSFRADGELDVLLDSGEIVLPGGHRVALGRGSRAHLTGIEATRDERGITVHGRVEIETALATELDPLALGAGIRVTRVAGAEGRMRITIDDAALGPDGSFHANGIAAEGRATVTRIRGRFTAPTPIAPPPATITRPDAEPPIALDAATSSLPAPVLPDPIALLDAIDSGTATVTVPISEDMSAALSLHVRNGIIDCVSGRVIVGGVVGELSLPVGIDLSALVRLELPEAVQRIVAFVREALGNPTAPNPFLTQPLTTLAGLGVVLDLAGVSFTEDARIGIGGDSYLTAAAGNLLSLHVEGGEARLSGRLTLDDGAIIEAGTGITGLEGEARVDVRVRGDGAARTIVATIDNLALDADRASFHRSNGDHIDLEGADLDGGSVVVRSRGGVTSVTTDLREIRGALIPSQLTVVVAGEAVPVTFPSGSFVSSLRSDGSHFEGNARVAGAELTTGAVDIPINGLDLHASGTRATFTGEMSFDSGMRTTLHGDIALEATVDRGSFGERRGTLDARLGRGTRASFHLTDLALGTFEDGHLIAAGSASIRMRMRGGHLTLPSGVRFDIAAGTAGTFTMDALSMNAGDALAEIDGSLVVRARTSATIPDGGLEIAPGIRVTRVDGARGEVEIHCRGFHLGRDGAFRIREIAIDAALAADALDVVAE
ncbi:MAG: hypothetical protein IT381_07465 [Deltaproteobacteria bacterium]|nr:hypothetical protein [Deltaproteobacteria bacterium]